MTENLYAVGDIHGCAGLLEKAIAWIEDNSRGRPTHTIFLGDYIDRGPDSKAVLDMLMSGPQRAGCRYTCLRGNHEQMCLDSDISADDMKSWLINGGDSALSSFGGRIDKVYKTWMAALPYWHEDDLRIFVHAGLAPGIPLVEQDPYDLVWIREEFFNSRMSFGKHVVHGHTPVGPMVLENRTNIDSGACHTGKLCVASFLNSSKPKPSFIKLIE